jgi:hypothetical protein
VISVPGGLLAGGAIIRMIGTSRCVSQARAQRRRQPCQRVSNLMHVARPWLKALDRCGMIGGHGRGERDRVPPADG